MRQTTGAISNIIKMKRIFLTILFFLIVFFNIDAQSILKADEYFRKADSLKKSASRDSALYYFEKAANEYNDLKETEKYVNSLSQIGALLTRQDKYVQAMAKLELALKTGLKELNANNPAIATIYFHMAVIYNAEGNYDKSLEMHAKALSMRLEKSGEYDSDVASSYGNMGNVYFNNKDFDKAIDYHHKALKIREKLFGNSNLEVVQSYNNLGNAYREKKDYKLALQNFEKTLEIRIAKLGAAHKDLVKSYKSISDVYYLMKNNEQGDAYKKKADDISNKQEQKTK
jgi:tetratricopeptide (TPR) repeat protein